MSKGDVKEVLYEGEDGSMSSRALAPEELDALKERQKAYDRLLSDRGLARYKVEVLFAKDYSVHKPTAGALTFWESGTKLHGGGDAKMYVCPGKSLGRNECEGFIPDPSQGLGFLVCPSCMQCWKGEEVIGEVLLRLNVQKWAEVLLQYFLRLDSNADLVMKYYPGSLISATGKEQEGQRFGEEFGRVRGQRVKRVYPLAHIIKDTSAGASLEGRILAFLRA